MSKKQLINQVLIWIETAAHQGVCNDFIVDDNEQLKWFLKSAENALEYKEKVIDKYKKLLSISVEDL